MNRRTFVRTAATLAAAGLADACSGTSGQPSATRSTAPPLSTTSPTPIATTPQTATAADWSALGQGLAGQLIQPADADYDTARLLFDPRFDSLRPAGIAFCDNPQDVAQCLAFVQR